MYMSTPQKSQSHTKEPAQQVLTSIRMLYDFHNYQNAQKANSVHATYLVYGTKSPDDEQSDGDVEMMSSLPELEETPISTLTLVREEELKGMSLNEGVTRRDN